MVIFIKFIILKNDDNFIGNISIYFIYTSYIFFIFRDRAGRYKTYQKMSYECEVLYHKVMMDWKRS